LIEKHFVDRRLVKKHFADRRLVENHFADRRLVDAVNRRLVDETAGSTKRMSAKCFSIKIFGAVY
jgi:hypothetical protein